MATLSVRGLKTTGQVTLAYPRDLRAAVEKANASWTKVCELPLEVKMTLPHSNNGAGFGYEPLRENGDRKENFDLVLSAESALVEWAKTVQNSIALDFVKDVLAIIPLMVPVAVRFAQDCEREFGLEGFGSEIERSVDRFFIRFIHYFPGAQPGDQIAEAHPDQSGFTLHLFESAPGLEYLPYKGKWSAMPVSEGETVIIPDMQMQLRSKGEIKALYHRVVATPETAREGRYSAVCFVQFADTPKYNKKAFGQLQMSKGPFKEAFNYEMPFEGFAKLFGNWQTFGGPHVLRKCFF